jgi:hypothetical protein
MGRKAFYPSVRSGNLSFVSQSKKKNHNSYGMHLESNALAIVIAMASAPPEVSLAGAIRMYK